MSASRDGAGTMPTTEQIRRKLVLSFGLLEAAIAIKKHRLRVANPGMAERDLTRKAMELIDRGLK